MTKRRTDDRESLTALEGFVPPIRHPARRPLKIFAFDPSLRRTGGNHAIVEVVNEPLKPGPVGQLVRVIDYNGTEDVYYSPIQLEDPAILIQRGLDPSDSDPRFHQQMVYAVVMKVIENFERALGRPFRFPENQRLTVLPHSFEGENAFYDPQTNSLHFGYFAADREDPGPNLPGQTIFTCLSHDIVAHETSHAIVHQLRPHFSAATNRDVLAFHEAIADIVAIFQHFSFPEVLSAHIRATRADLSQPGPLLELARQFGYATGGGRALRTAAAGNGERPDPRLYDDVLEAHDRGSILVAAVFDAFFRIYRNRTAGLLRAVSGGSGILPAGELQSDLAVLVSREASSTAQDVLTMCLRAFEYLPPVDVTFGDYLRALITADFELNPRDEFERRASFIDAFRLRGIYAPAVSSLAEEALRLEQPQGPFPPAIPPSVVTQTLVSQFDYIEGGQRKYRDDPAPGMLRTFAQHNAAALGFDPNLPEECITVEGMHPSFHVDENGQLLVELVAQWTQTPPPGNPTLAHGGVELKAGATAIFADDGTARYVAARPLPGNHLDNFPTQQQAAQQRVEGFSRYVNALDGRDPLQTWCGADYEERRMKERGRLALAHVARPTRRREQRPWVHQSG